MQTGEPKKLEYIEERVQLRRDIFVSVIGGLSSVSEYRQLAPGEIAYRARRITEAAMRELDSPTEP